MTLPTPALISQLPRGHEFTPTTFSIGEAVSAAYAAAVGDAQTYDRAVPPLAAVALGLAALQRQVALPEGSLHTGQEVEHEATIVAGEALRLTGRVAQRSQRQGFVISVLEYEISASRGVALRARTTIMAPVGAA